MISTTTSLPVAGTTGLCSQDFVKFSTSVGSLVWSPPVNISSGEAGSNGSMYQSLNFIMEDITWGLPAGTYTTQLPLTLTPDGP